jgi:hypothetical protein
MFSQNDLVQVTREVEVTPGVVTGGARSRVYGTAPTLTPGGNTLTSGINTGDGGVKSVRAGLRFADAEVPSELVFGLNHEELADCLRDTWPVAEAKTAELADLTFAQAGTHEDGSTGPTITSITANAFDNLLDMAGCMLEITGAGINAANKRPRVIKAVKADGLKIDIDPRYTAGSVGEIGEPLIPEGPVTGTLNCGKVIRNRGVTAIRSVNFEFEFTEQAGGSFLMARGQYASSMKLGFDGKGIVTLSVMYTGMDFDDPTTVTQGNGTVTANPYLDNDSVTSAEDLTYFLVNGVIQLAGDNLTSFNLDGNGNASGIDDTSGSRQRVGVTVGDLDFSGSLKLLHEHTKMTQVTTFSRAGNRVPLDWKFADPGANFYWFRLPETLFEPASSKPGAKGSRTDGTFNFKTQLGANGIRTFIVQAFEAA